MSVSGYSTPQVLLHWLSAVVILWVLMAGFYVALADVSPQSKQAVAFINVSLSTLFIPFFVWRLCLAVSRARPVGVKSQPLLETLALLVHVALYLTVSVVLLSGVLMMDRPISVFDLFQFAQPLSDPVLIARFLTVHFEACVFLSLLLVMHIGAVVFHEVRGRRVLRRMALRRPGAPPPHARHK